MQHSFRTLKSKRIEKLRHRFKSYGKFVHTVKFCLLVEWHWEGSATNGAALSGIQGYFGWFYTYHINHIGLKIPVVRLGECLISSLRGHAQYDKKNELHQQIS